MRHGKTSDTLSRHPNWALYTLKLNSDSLSTTTICHNWVVWECQDSSQWHCAGDKMFQVSALCCCRVLRDLTRHWSSGLVIDTQFLLLLLNYFQWFLSSPLRRSRPGTTWPSAPTTPWWRWGGSRSWPPSPGTTRRWRSWSSLKETWLSTEQSLEAIVHIRHSVRNEDSFCWESSCSPVDSIFSVNVHNQFPSGEARGEEEGNLLRGDSLQIISLIVSVFSRTVKNRLLSQGLNITLKHLSVQPHNIHKVRPEVELQLFWW